MLVSFMKATTAVSTHGHPFDSNKAFCRKNVTPMEYVKLRWLQAMGGITGLQILNSNGDLAVSGLDKDTTNEMSNFLKERGKLPSSTYLRRNKKAKEAILLEFMKETSALATATIANS